MAYLNERDLGICWKYIFRCQQYIYDIFIEEGKEWKSVHDLEIIIRGCYSVPDCNGFDEKLFWCHGSVISRPIFEDSQPIVQFEK